MKNPKCCFLCYADHASKTLYVDTASMKRAGQIDSPEFAEFQRIREKVQNYKIEVKAFPKTKKRTYSGLTFDLMQAFIIQYEEVKEKREAALIELNKAKAGGLLRGSAYGSAKSWFLNNYGTAYNKSEMSQSGGKRKDLIDELLASVAPALLDPVGSMQTEGGVSNG